MENKTQLLTKFHFPQMHSKIKKTTDILIKISLQEKTTLLFPGQIVHMDIFMTEKEAILTAIDKFSKFARGRILRSRVVEDVKEPLRELLLFLECPKRLLQKKSFNSTFLCWKISIA